MVISDLFDSYLSWITPSEAEFEAARGHRDNVQRRITIEGVVEFINSGSYIKRTAIRPFEDIDLFVGLDRDEYEKDHEKVVTRLAYQLGQSFPRRVRTQEHSVGVLFANLRVDVVPGFAYRTKPGSYRIRNRVDGRWLETNIARHKEFFQTRLNRDRRHRDMIQLVKAWIGNRRTRYGSYLMELLVSRAFAQGIPQGKDRALHEFFSWMARGGLAKPIIFNDYYDRRNVKIPGDPLVVLDPTNPRNNVGGDLDARAVEELISVADRARARSGTALEENSRHRASSIWGELLPGFSPA